MTQVRITQPVRVRLAQLEKAHGRLTPAVVVADARQKKSPLHDLFSWNVEEAAQKYWLHRAREIIQSVRLVSSETETVTVDAPFYVRDPSLLPSEQGYVSIATLQKNPVQARESLRLEFERVTGALTRARSIAAALGLESEVEELIAHVTRVKERVAA